MAGSFAASIKAPGLPADSGPEPITRSPGAATRTADDAQPPGRKRDDLVRDIGHEFARPALLDEALTHPSAPMPERRGDRRRQPAQRNYQRLEFLGDRVLGL